LNPQIFFNFYLDVRHIRYSKINKNKQAKNERIKRFNIGGVPFPTKASLCFIFLTILIRHVIILHYAARYPLGKSFKKESFLRSFQE